jgi:hypothetical protein
MNLQIGTRIILFIMVLVIGSFDRHLSNYFPAEVKAMIQADSIPMHSDLPVISSDYHEDITIRESCCTFPVPVVVSVDRYSIFHPAILQVSPHSVWQPPEHLA